MLKQILQKINFKIKFNKKFFFYIYRGMQKNVIQTKNVLIRDIDTIQGVLETAFTTLMPKCIEWPKITCSSR